MATIVARTGRHRQRYDDDKFRLVAGAWNDILHQRVQENLEKASLAFSGCIFGLSSMIPAFSGKEYEYVAEFEWPPKENVIFIYLCIPYRLKENADIAFGIESRVEVLMITSPNRNDLVFPKGGWEDDETVGEAACREALEEAGVRGILDENQLGVWEFRSKSKQNSCSKEGSCRGYMFALEVTEEVESWPEQTNRARIWLSVKNAFELCRYDWMRRALEEFLRVLSEDGKHWMTEDTVPITASAPMPEVAEHPIPLTA